jgi:hypothetical protein
MDNFEITLQVIDLSIKSIDNKFYLWRLISLVASNMRPQTSPRDVISNEGINEKK